MSSSTKQTAPAPQYLTFAVVLTVVLVAGLIAPVASALVALIGVAVLSGKPKVAGFTTVGVVGGIFAWINMSKVIQGDWSWYVQHYLVLEYTPLSSYLGVFVRGVRPDPSEPLYYLLARFLSVASGGNVELLAFVVTCVIYGAIGTALVLALTSATRNPWTVVVGTSAGMLVGLTFTLTTQLVRQEISAALIGLAVVTSAYRKWTPTVMIVVAAALTHNSALIPAAGLGLAVLFRRRGGGRPLRFAISGAVFYALGQLYLTTSGNSDYTGQDDGAISTAVIALDAVILGTFLFLVWRRGLGENAVASTVLLCVPAFYGFVLGVASQPLPLLRMYFYIEVLRALMVVLICVSLVRGQWDFLIGLAIVGLAIAYLLLRIEQSPFVYGISPLDLLLWMPLTGLGP